MNRQLNRLGQKIQGTIQQLGQKLSNTQHLGHKIQHNVSIGLRKAINTAGEIGDVGQKALPYMYGIAHATGIGNEVIPILHAAGKGLKRINEGKEYLQNVRRSVVE